MRFDDAHGRFHWHATGWPEPSPQIAEYLGNVPKHQRTAFATAQIQARYTLWEAEVFGREGDMFQ